MTGVEKSDIETPDYLTPEYWAGHTPYDSCVAAEFTTVPLNKMGELEKSSASFLNEFLSLPGKNMVRSFRDNETFSAEQERDGTILRVNIEKLDFKGDHPASHTSPDRWGVVGSYEDEDGTNKIIAVFDVSKTRSKIFNFWGLLIPDLTVSVVDHVRRVREGVIREEYFRRINKLEIFRNGTPLREGNPRTRFIAKFPKLPNLRPAPQRV